MAPKTSITFPLLEHLEWFDYSNLDMATNWGIWPIEAITPRLVSYGEHVDLRRRNSILITHIDFKLITDLQTDDISSITRYPSLRFLRIVSSYVSLERIITMLEGLGKDPKMYPALERVELFVPSWYSPSDKVASAILVIEGSIQSIWPNADFSFSRTLNPMPRGLENLDVRLCHVLSMRKLTVFLV